MQTIRTHGFLRTARFLPHVLVPSALPVPPHWVPGHFGSITPGCIPPHFGFHHIWAPPHLGPTTFWAPPHFGSTTLRVLHTSVPPNFGSRTSLAPPPVVSVSHCFFLSFSRTLSRGVSRGKTCSRQFLSLPRFCHRTSSEEMLRVGEPPRCEWRSVQRNEVQLENLLNLSIQVSRGNKLHSTPLFSRMSVFGPLDRKLIRAHMSEKRPRGQ